MEVSGRLPTGIEDWALVRGHRDRRLGEGDMGPNFSPAREGKLVDGFKGLDVGDRVRVELVETKVEQGFIDFARAEKSESLSMM